MNTMEMATNFEGSALQKQLLEVRPQSFGGTSSPSVVKKETPKAVVEPEASDSNDDDDWS